MIDKFIKKYPNLNLEKITNKGLQIDNENSDFLKTVYQGHLF